MKSFVRLGGAAGSLALLVILAGCEPRSTIVAQINDETVNEKDYNLRVQSVTTIPETLDTDAGGMTMINIIRDKLTDQLAHKSKAVPSEATVAAAAEYQIRVDPNTSQGINSGKLLREDLLRQKRFELEAFGIGTNGDKPSEQDLDKTYEEYKNKPDCRISPSFTAKVLQVPDDATGRRVIEFLTKTSDFKGAAEKILKMSPMEATAKAKEQRLSFEQWRPELRAALDKLKPNEVTPQPVAITISDPQQPLNSQTIYAVAQLEAKEPGRTLSKDEVRFLLEPLVVQKTHPDWKEHYLRELADFTRKSQIRVAIERYRDLVDTYIMPRADAQAANPHAGIAAPPQTGTQPGTLK